MRGYKKPEQDLSRETSRQCSDFGIVNSVKIHRGQRHFAPVEMATHEAALSLSARFQRTAFGNELIIYPEQIKP